ncbi:blue copper protein 1b-like [Actinidia eriantha]|uniref:blue copper protein 1b-like n=1 Tax=Actinidia eriantha TaxID=165200 RepID=UPI0025892C18|nr:blue copper protein 1b-like [Actinidia eriantha]
MKMSFSLAKGLILLVTAASMLAATSQAETIVVGGSEGWRFGFNYTDWSLKNSPFFVNDKLVFKYKPTHNVYSLPNLGSFIKCDFRGAKLLASATQGGGGGYGFTLQTLWRPLYIASNVGTDCKDGLMKFFVVPLPSW